MSLVFRYRVLWLSVARVLLARPVYKLGGGEAVPVAVVPRGNKNDNSEGRIRSGMQE